MSTASKPATAALALLTGASSGTGSIYADRLAKRGQILACQMKETNDDEHCKL